MIFMSSAERMELRVARDMELGRRTKFSGWLGGRWVFCRFCSRRRFNDGGD